MATKSIDLGRKASDTAGPAVMADKKDPKVYYPSVYISGVDGASFPLGEISFTAKGEVVSCKKDGCEIEIHSMTPSAAAATKKDAGEGLDEALDGIAADKEATDDPAEADETDE